VGQDTTLTGLVRDYLEKPAAESARSGRKQKELTALRRTFEKYQFNIGDRTWKREEFYERK
jgi:hypothetical protein